MPLGDVPGDEAGEKRGGQKGEAWLASPHLGSKEEPATSVPSATASELGVPGVCLDVHPKGETLTPRLRATPPVSPWGMHGSRAGGHWLPRLPSGGHMPAIGRASFSTPTGPTPSPSHPLPHSSEASCPLLRASSPAPHNPRRASPLRSAPSPASRGVHGGGWCAWEVRRPPGDVWVWPQNPHGGATWEQSPGLLSRCRAPGSAVLLAYTLGGALGSGFVAGTVPAR